MSHLFDSFRIGHFRGFTDVELADCGAVNLLIGANNSGKSSILEALALYGRPFDQAEWMAVVHRRDARTGYGARVDDLLWLFQRTDSGAPALPQFHLELSATGDVAISHLSASARRAERMVPVNSYRRDDQPGGLEKRTGVEIEVTVSPLNVSTAPRSEKFHFWSKGFSYWAESEFSLDLQSLTPFSHRIEPEQVSAFTSATTGEWKSEVLELLRQIDPAILNLEILDPTGNSSTLGVKYSGLPIAPLSTLGDGLRRIISIALAIGNLKNGLLLIDEIESAVHVSALETVFPWLTAACKKNNVQLFATTHSLEALDALLETPEGKEMVCYRLNRPDQPERIHRIDPRMARQLRFERGFDLR